MTPLRIPDAVLDGIRYRHAFVEAETDSTKKLLRASDMAFLSHLDRAELLNHIAYMASAASPAQDEDQILLIIARSIGRTVSTENHHERARDVLRSVREADLALPQPTRVAASPAVPEGYWLAPIKATDEMHMAAHKVLEAKHIHKAIHTPMTEDAWEAMRAAAPLPPAASAWRTDMENAPRGWNAPLIFVWVPIAGTGRVNIVRWDEEDGDWREEESELLGAFVPTHWQPMLPPPPSQEGG